jgi:hypothetical protein
MCNFTDVGFIASPAERGAHHAAQLSQEPTITGAYLLLSPKAAKAEARAATGCTGSACSCWWPEPKGGCARWC